MSTRYAYVLLVLNLAVAATARADITPQRAEFPIKLVAMKDGTHRYSVPVKVGETTIEAGLDTGSDGLRILPGNLQPGDFEPTLERDTVTYGAGAKLDGIVATGPVEIGGLKGEARFEIVDKVGCRAQKPNCAAGRIALADYGIMGNGVVGAGFKAILGIGPRTVRIDNPLRRVGVRRFIVELPRDAGENGRIVLNPTPVDTADFIVIPAYRRGAEQKHLPDDTVAGCLVTKPKDAKTEGAKVCGAMTFDTGSHGIRVLSPDPLGEAWPQGTTASIVLEDGAGHPLAGSDLTIGSRSEASHLAFLEKETLPKTVIRAGIAPYLAFSVLYDLDHDGLAVKPRPPRP